MTYDKNTGDVTIHKTASEQKKRKIIRSFDDAEKMRRDLYKELDLEDDGLPKENADFDALKEKIKDAKLRSMKESLDIDPTVFYAHTFDHMRIDVGLMIQRPPIFLRWREQEKNFMVDRQKFMNEHYLDQRQYINDWLEVSKLNEDILANNPYTSRMNLDNYPTHQMKDPKTGETQEYCAASKNWKLVDPACTDPKSLHYASEDRVYMIFKNKFT